MSSATPSAVSLAWDRSRDNVGVQGYGVYLDGSVVAKSSQPGATISGLACGRAYTFGVDAFDAAGNHSRKAWATVATAACPDQQAPTAPTGFRQQAATQTEVVLAWDASTDNVGVVGYGVYRNGLLQTSTAAPSVTLSGFVCGSVYEVAVDAADAAGNRSEPRATWVKTTACSDTEPPSKPILSLGEATETSLALNWQPGVDNVGVDHYNVFLDGVKVAETTALTWTYTGLACDTDYALGLEVEDAAGNTSLLAEATWAPVRTSACSPAPPPADTTAPSQPGNLAVSAATTTSVTLAWAASSDNVGVAGYGVYVNGASAQTTTQPGATVSGLGCGTAYTLAVDAYDLAGNRSTKASLMGTTAPCADTQAPSAPANLAVTSRTATSIALSWSASSDNVGVVGYGLYRGTTLTGTTAVTTGIFSNLACGSAFTLAVDSYDAAGNRSGKTTISASTTACPDTTSPSMPTGLSASNVTGTSLTLGWNASTDNVGVTGYDVYRNGTKVASLTGTSASQTGLDCGTSYAFAVVSYDAAGNRSSQAQLTAPTATCAAAPPPPPPPPPPPSGADLFVSPSGSDSNPCSQAAPCRSFARAFAVASAGDVVQVGDGVYPTGVANIESGSKQVTFRGNLGGNSVRGINIGADNVTFEGINVDPNMVNDAMGVYHHADNVTFRNSRIGNILNERAVLLAGSVNAVFDNVLFHDVVSNDPNVHNECIQSYLGEGAVVRNSTFINCATMDWSLGYPGHWTPLPPPFGSITIEDNRFYCSRYTNNQGCHAYGLAIWSTQQQGLPGQPEFGWLHNFSIRRNWFENAVIVRSVDDGTSVICGNTGVAPESWKAAC